MDLIATYADDIGTVLAHPLGMWIPVAVGFALLMFINYRERRAVSSSSEASVPTESEQIRGARERLERVAYQAKQENDSLRRKVQELEAMSPDEYRARQEERRRRIQRWRAEISTSNFNRTPLVLLC